MNQRIKKKFPLLANKHAKLIYLDSAATTHKPQEVIAAISRWYVEYNANAGRGVYALAEKATELLASCRKTVADFINATSDEIVFTKGTTESINLVALAWAQHNLKKNDTILITELEHHANIVPWQLLASKIGCTIKYWPLSSSGALEKITTSDWQNVKLVCVTHVSNTTGTINPINKIIKDAHVHGAKVLVDAAQSSTTEDIDIKKLKADFLAFSGHKMFGPTGIGILYINKERLKECMPVYGGGEAIEQVTFTGTIFKQGFEMLEPGTLPLAQVAGLQSAIQFIQKISKQNIKQYTESLAQYTRTKLVQIPELFIMPYDKKSASHIISFTVHNLHPHDLATWLDNYNIAVRAGHHCAQPLHDTLGITASVRVSLQIYNSKSDIDYFITSLKKIIQESKQVTL